MTTALEKLSKLRADLPFVKKEKPPRTYADEILELKTKEERREALEKVPEDMRQLVKFYIYDHYAKRQRKSLPDLVRKES